MKFRRRQIRRNPRRPLEAVPQDFERWDMAANRVGLNWSEFARRALNTAADAAGVPTTGALAALGALSEKGAFEKLERTRAKPAAKPSGRKG